MSQGHIRRQGQRSWEISVELPTPPGARRRRKYRTVRGTKRDAQKALRELLKEVDASHAVSPSDHTLESFLQLWLRDHASQTLKKNTLESYRQLTDTHIIPSLGNLKLHEIHPLHLQQFYGDKLRTGRKDGRGGLAPQTIRYMHAVISKALEAAVQWNLLAHNPARSASPPKQSKPEMKYWERNHVKRFLEVASETDHHVLYATAVLTGLRRGELLGLKWQDIDLKGHKIAVRRSYTRAPDGSLSIDETKSNAGRRVVNISPDLAELLSQHQRIFKENRLALGAAHTGEDFVFCWPDGSPVAPDVISQHFRRLITRADLPRIRFHDLRHTHATLMLEAGVHPKIVSERLGHSRVSFTLDIYSHALPSLQAEAAVKLAESLKTISGSEGWESVGNSP